MKDKTHSMNRDHGGSGTGNGYEKIPNSEVRNESERKMRQLKWANLEDNEALLKYENKWNDDEDMYGGFLPRNNYEDRN